MRQTNRDFLVANENQSGIAHFVDLVIDRFDAKRLKGTIRFKLAQFGKGYHKKPLVLHSPISVIEHKFLAAHHAPEDVFNRRAAVGFGGGLQLLQGLRSFFLSRQS